MNPQKPREIAFRVLRRHLGGAAYVEDLLHEELEAARLSARDRALAHELVCGVVRWQAALDWLIAQKTAARRQKGALQVLLRLGLYQLFWLDRVPDHAAVNETVHLARNEGLGAQAGFVNAVLREYVRQRDGTRAQLDQLKTTDPAVGWSHPAWLVERWQRRWGTADTTALLAWNNSPAPTFARVNTLKTEPGKLLERWREENVGYDFGRWDWIEENLVFRLTSHPDLRHLGSFRDGWFYVQDPSTLLAAQMLDPQPGQHILDCCAAPGGKSTLLAQRLGNQGQIVAREASADRLRALRENCVRLGATCVRPELVAGSAGGAGAAAGAGAGGASDEAAFDRVLVDAPCSNSGVMRRRVDLRWRIRPEELRRLQDVQWALLERAIPSCKVGGLMAYSTCSLEPEENRQVVERLLAGRSFLRLVAERELTPVTHGVDGAYVAVFRREA